MTMEAAPSFGETDAYERFMGRWSRAVAGPFLHWLQAPSRANWLDVGCGTGILSQAVLSHCAPATLQGIDTTPAQIAHAAAQIGDKRARFEVADAQALPFADGSFDIVASALVLNFVPEPHRALAQMRRVVRRGGIVGAYVWDFEPELSPSGPLRKALGAMGIDVPKLPGTAFSALPALAALFEGAGFTTIATTGVEVAVSFADFADLWDSQTTPYSPTTKIIAALGPDARASLLGHLRTRLTTRDDGTVTYGVRANAIKARAPD